MRQRARVGGSWNNQLRLAGGVSLLSKALPPPGPDPPSWLCRPKPQGQLRIMGRRGLTEPAPCCGERKWVSRMGRSHPSRGSVFTQTVPAGDKTTQRETGRQRQRDKERDRDRETQTERQREMKQIPCPALPLARGLHTSAPSHTKDLGCITLRPTEKEEEAPGRAAS